VRARRTAGLLALALAACSSASASRETALPSYTPPNPPAYPAARLNGVLSLRDGCAYLDNGDTLLVWYPGTHLVAKDGRTTVVSPSGDPIGAIGETVALGGGYVGKDAPMLAAMNTACTSHALAVVAP
jgi:hypothetical protein